MNCRRTKVLLLECLEQRLPPASAAAVKGHLAACARCRSELESLQRTLALIAEDAVPPMPVREEVFLQNVRRRIRQPARSASRLRLVPFFAAAAAIVIAAGIFLSSRHTGQPAEIDSIVTSTDFVTSDLIDQAGEESELVRELDAPSLASIESELTDNADLDDLVEDLTPNQQETLVKELTRLYGAVKESSTGG
jgi:anti-sigma factor RsiW